MLFLCIGAVASLAMSAVFLTNGLVDSPSRADLTVYGRYVDQWVPVGIVLAVSLSRRQLIGAGAAVVSFLVLGVFMFRSRYTPDVWTRPSALHNIAGVTGPRHFTGSLDLARDGIWFVIATSVALAIGVVRNLRWTAVVSRCCSVHRPATSSSLIGQLLLPRTRRSAIAAPVCSPGAHRSASTSGTSAPSTSTTSSTGTMSWTSTCHMDRLTTTASSSAVCPHHRNRRVV